MKHLILIAVICTIATLDGYCQSRKLNSEISYLKLKDTILTNNINNLINREVNADTSKNNAFRKGLGYIFLKVTQHTGSDTIRQYYISPQLISFKEDTPDKLYPDYYSYVNDRLVIIQLEVLDGFTFKNYTAKTKSNFRKLVNSYLEKPKKMTFYDENEKKAFTDKNFRIDYFKFDSGIYIYILNNGLSLVVNEH